MPINYDEIDSNEESINNLYNPNHPDGQAYLNSSKAKLDNHLKLIEQDPYHKVHAHPSNLANTISHYYGIVERQKNFKSNKGNLTPEHLLNIHKLALNHADHHINRIRAQGMRTEGTVSKVKNIRNTFNNIVKEAVMQWRPGGSWKKEPSYVSPLELGQVKYHFLDTQNPDKHVGESAITRALANLHTDKGDPNNPKAAIVSHPFAYDLKQLHELAQHHERRMRDAQMYLDKDPLAPKGRFKNDAHAASSFKKWSNHLHTLHSDVMRGLLDAQDKGHQLPEGFKGLTPEHVVNHAAKRGVDISQPFDSAGFTKKVRDFGRHSRINRTSVNHPLYQGWKTPPAPPAAPAPQVESNIMNKSQRIRDIFNNLIEAQSSQSKAWGREMAKGIAQQRGRTEQEIASSEELVKKGVMPEVHTDIVKNIMAKSHAQLKRSAKRVGREILGKQNDSTNYARAGLKALFESVLDEVSQRAANKAYWEGEGKSFKGAGIKLKNLTNKFKAQQKQPDSEKPPAEKPKAP